MEKVYPKLEIRNGKFYLLEDFYYHFPYDNLNNDFVYVRIPRGYQTNFASIPSFVRGIISPIDPQIVEAALVHDFLTSEFGDIAGYPKAIIHDHGMGIQSLRYDYTNWKQAIATMRGIMGKEGAPLWKRQAVYIAVRAYGVIKGKK